MNDSRRCAHSTRYSRRSATTSICSASTLVGPYSSVPGSRYWQHIASQKLCYPLATILALGHSVRFACNLGLMHLVVKLIVLHFDIQTTYNHVNGNLTRGRQEETEAGYYLSADLFDALFAYLNALDALLDQLPCLIFAILHSTSCLPYHGSSRWRRSAHLYTLSVPGKLPFGLARTVPPNRVVSIGVQMSHNHSSVQSDSAHWLHTVIRLRSRQRRLYLHPRPAQDRGLFRCRRFLPR